MNDRHRVFLALPLPEEIRVGIAQFRTQHPSHDLAGFRWLPDANLHLTVYYLGYIRTDDTSAVVAAIAAILGDHAPLILAFQEFTTQPKRRPSMLWARFKTEQAYVDLYHAVAAAVQPYCLDQRQQFPRPIPHITLARFKQPPPEWQDTPGPPLTTWIGEKPQLWLSASAPGGVVYRPLAHFRLGQS